MGFVFVDRINAIDADRARGELHRAADAPPLPPWLVIEAVGQLAAWIAMARSDFATRPVAALVGEVRLAHLGSRGTLALEAQIDRLDSRAVLYSGRARSGDREIAILRRCVGPLLPTAAFDDPAALRRRFAALREDPVPSGAGGAKDPLPRATLSDLLLQSDTATARLHIPTADPLFADHFPRRPVYPAALLADAQSQVAAPLAAQVLGVAPHDVLPSYVADFKVRAFSAPGQVLHLAAERQPSTDEMVTIAISARTEDRRIASGVLGYRVAPAS